MVFVALALEFGMELGVGMRWIMVFIACVHARGLGFVLIQELACVLHVF